MHRLYMGLWWFCFIQWPLFNLYLWTDATCFNDSIICELITLFTVYMVIFAPFMPLPVVLTIILVIRVWTKKIIGKLEKALALGSWACSLFAAYEFFIVSGGHLG